MVLSVSERTFTQEVLQSPVPVLVHFWAPWCGLCRNIEPLLLQFQTQWGHQIKVVGINADENFKLANSFRLTTLPTLILLEDGNPKRRWESLRGREELRAELEKIQLFYSENQLYSIARVNSSFTPEWERRLA
ncbi:thioredoxin family protein [Gloeocapsopsis dulcis]|uniref:Thiol reductase thioredoxin n=1 Tax=Gloeocapsopsis dulcis AAB1 = 1H9 TaxID=1433147 RepID=A0A6N8FX10_9CHRO|nr:thioredoxin domain-containing protein [Gloeocapsopsis dulcis]MUL36486.1 thiol reductase thioredoxin [Gloeocapsopsis dulcis AAB1 = 1H9]WNN87772.1 thioredoxin domain-containing protein [Gloeocapsopsis dulcis]